MNYWYDIVKSYDNPKSKDPKKKDDGTYSQFSVVTLLIYLAFGSDYPYNMAKYFQNISNPAIKKKRSSVLRHESKIGTLLNKMEADGLVTSTRTERRKFYKLNPRIIQFPAMAETYVKTDGSAFEIPLDKIDGLLAWQKENIEQFDAKNLFFRTVLFSNVVDYITFMIFLEKEAKFQEKVCEKITWKYDKQIEILSPNFNPLANRSDCGLNWMNKVCGQMKPDLNLLAKYMKSLSDLISEYIEELEGLFESNLDLGREHGLRFEQFIPNQTKAKDKKICRFRKSRPFNPVHDDFKYRDNE